MRVNTGLGPALRCIPIHRQHVIARVLTKDQFIVWNTGFSSLGQLCRQVSVLKGCHHAIGRSETPFEIRQRPSPEKSLIQFHLVDRH